MSDRISPMWLAHHFPEDYDRCVRIGRTHVCRRCLVLYPLAAAVMLLALGAGVDRSWLELALVVLPLPAVVELVLEQFGVLSYAPRRQVAVTVPLAVGLGSGFAVYLDDQTNRVFWGVVVLYTAICGGAVWWRYRRR